MDQDYYALYIPRPRAISLDRATLETLLAQHEARLADLRAEERGTVKLTKAEKAYLWGMQEATKATIRAIRAQLAGRAVSKQWPYQAQLDLLVQSGFVEIDPDNTAWWERYNADNGISGPLPMYRWTEAGRKACWRYEYTTPMAWANDIRRNKVRFCEGCGRDLYRQTTWERWGKRLLCRVCGRAGKSLEAQS